MEALSGDREITNKTTKVNERDEKYFFRLFDLDDLSVKYFVVNLELRSQPRSKKVKWREDKWSEIAGVRLGLSLRGLEKVTIDNQDI